MNDSLAWSWLISGQLMEHWSSAETVIHSQTVLASHDSVYHMLHAGSELGPAQYEARVRNARIMRGRPATITR